MKNTLRQDDILGRWGGEEFLVAISDANKTKAYAILERMRTNVERECFYNNENEICVTVTVGLVDSSQGDINKLLKFADNALYIGKRSSKNCVIVG